MFYIARHAQSTQNNNFTKYLQCLKKNGGMKLISLHTDKHHVFLQVDAINFGGHGQACQKYPKEQFWKIIFISQESSGFFIEIS